MVRISWIARMLETVKEVCRAYNCSFSEQNGWVYCIWTRVLSGLLPGPLAYSFLPFRFILLRFLRNLSKQTEMSGTVKQTDL